MDLTLVPIEELIKEIENRSDCFVCGYILHKDKDKIIMTQYGSGTWHQACSISNILNNDVLNNWHNELQILQRICKEREGLQGEL